MVVLILLALVADDGANHIQDTELFQVMRPNEVFLADDGEIYVLNFDESRVQHYDAEGNLAHMIGGKGKGPGQFTFPTYLNLVGDQLVVYDRLTQRVSEFERDGTFIRQVRTPQQVRVMQRTLGGWFYWNRAIDPDQPTNLMWADPAFENQRVIMEIENPGWGQGTSVTSNDGRVTITYSPLNVQPILAGSPDGSLCYFADAEKFEILVFDGRTGEKIRTITRKDPAIPFDEEWADTQFEEDTEDTRRRNAGTRIDKLYPEFFPAIRSLQFDPDGHLIVDRWRGRPDDNHNLVAYDDKGNEIEVRYSWNLLRRFIGRNGDHAYVLTFNEETDAGVAKVPFSQMQAYIEAHPVDNWSNSRSITISN